MQSHQNGVELTIHTQLQEEEEDADDEKTVEDVPPKSTIAAEFQQNVQDVKDTDEVIKAVDSCATRQLIHDTLETYYIPLELWYARTIIDKVRRTMRDVRLPRLTSPARPIVCPNRT